MNTFEIQCLDEFNNEHQIHIVAPNAGDAMIMFRQTESFRLWHVDTVRQVSLPTVLQGVDNS